MRVFITGITGTLGTALAKLHCSRGDTVVGCARGEQRCRDWIHCNPGIASVYVADASTISTPDSLLSLIFKDMDRVYHCAAMKHIDLCESNPQEAYRQNVQLTSIVTLACANSKIPLVFPSSDKACLPQSVYGATKLIGERIVLNQYPGLPNEANAKVPSINSVVRLGNLIGSSGSVFERWTEQVKKGERIKLTDSDMTRYFIEVDRAAEFMSTSLPGSITIPWPMKSVHLGDVASRLGNRDREGSADYSPSGVDIIGPRPGETTHQWLTAPGDNVRIDETRIVLGGPESRRYSYGIRSHDGQKWDVQELLERAGL